jgi:TonB family protein
VEKKKSQREYFLRQQLKAILSELGESTPEDNTEERIELIPEQREKGPGVTIAIVASVILHTATLIYLVNNYKPVSNNAANTPITRYVELIRRNPQQERERQFDEAPGAKLNSAPLNAPWSDANRRASTPNPTGTNRTTRPGDGSNLYVPQSVRSGGNSEGMAAAQPQQQPRTAQQATAPAKETASPLQTPTDIKPLTTYQPTQPTQSAVAPNNAVEWKNAIREVGKVASLGGSRQGGADIQGSLGGEKGFADNGPVSFESQWYNWGEYAESMVSRIRVNWMNNMPELLRTGLKGNVTIRFTIHRDGRISDVTILSTSTIPPYDFAAKKAIELSSPLNPLPKDFPMATERVTCGFYYNMEVPASH